MKNISTIEYAGSEFVVRDCEWSRFGVTVSRRVASHRLGNLVRLYEGDDLARAMYGDVDEDIAYYIAEDLLLGGSDEDILQYVIDNIDDGILDEFTR